MLSTVLLIYAAVSAATLIAYGYDKRCAARGRRRLRERTLHWLAVLGGWPGAVIGQQLFRHKRRKGGFMLVTAAIIVAHGVAWALAMSYR